MRVVAHVEPLSEVEPLDEPLDRPLDRTGTVPRRGWRMTGTDPAFRLAGFDPLPRGLYRLRVDLEGDPERLWRPKLYLDRGDGFDETGARSLRLRTAVGAGNGGVEAYFVCDGPVRAIRFDPSELPGTLVMGEIVIERARQGLDRLANLARVGRERVSRPAGLRRIASGAWRHWREGGLRDVRRAVARAARDAPVPVGPGGDGYARWVRLYDTMSEDELARQREVAEVLDDRPLVSVLMPTYNPPGPLLEEAIASVRAQTYDRWELCIADDASTEPHVREILERAAAADLRIKVAFRERNGHICESSNTALDLCEGEWIALLDHDDMLAPNALYEIVRAAAAHPDARLLYSDEDKIDEHGRRSHPYFKSAWNQALMRSHNVVTHLAAYRGDDLRRLRFRTGAGVEGAQDHDLVLRQADEIGPERIVHIPRILYHWRMHEASTSGSTEAKPYTLEAGCRAIGDHLERIGLKGEVRAVPIGFHVAYDRKAYRPLVSVVIPTFNGLDLLRTCLESFREITAYRNVEFVVVDNRSDDRETLAYLRKIGRRRNVRVLRDERPFNYSALNNAAVAACEGELVLFMNNDIEVLDPDWLDEMVSLMADEGIGAVGAKLLYPDRTVQHAGVVVGLGGVAGHVHQHLPAAAAGYMGKALLRQDMSACTAACLLTRRALFEELGGFDEEHLAIAYNDVDYCLKVRAAGLRVVWTPHAELLHHESATRGSDVAPEKVERFRREQSSFVERWAGVVANDPAYNPNLSAANDRYELAFPPRDLAPRTSRLPGTGD